MDDAPASLFALRLEYVVARRELEAIRDARRAGDAREEQLADRVQTLLLLIHEAERGIKED